MFGRVASVYCQSRNVCTGAIRYETSQAYACKTMAHAGGSALKILQVKVAIVARLSWYCASVSTFSHSIKIQDATDVEIFYEKTRKKNRQLETNAHCWAIRNTKDSSQLKKRPQIFLAKIHARWPRTQNKLEVNFREREEMWKSLDQKPAFEFFEVARFGETFSDMYCDRRVCN